MTRSRWWSRLLTMLFAAGQLALPASLSVGDALVSGDARSTFAHAEDASRAACKAPHADDCAVCRYLTALVGAPPAPVVELPHLRCGQSTGLVTAAADSYQGHVSQSRAPPARNV